MAVGGNRGVHRLRQGKWVDPRGAQKMKRRTKRRKEKLPVVLCARDKGGLLVAGCGEWTPALFGTRAAVIGDCFGLQHAEFGSGLCLPQFSVLKLSNSTPHRRLNPHSISANQEYAVILLFLHPNDTSKNILCEIPGPDVLFGR